MAPFSVAEPVPAWLITLVYTFPNLTRVIEQGMGIGLHLGAVVHARLHGQIVADFSVGSATLQPAKPLRPDQQLLWLSAGKPLTALAIGILVDRGRLSFDDPVCHHIPDFAQNGKDGITIRQVLMQAHSYKPPRVDWVREPRENVIAAICEAPMIRGVLPGEFAAYDPQSGWYLLSEIISRATGLPHYEFVQSELLEPLGCSRSGIGMTAEAWTTARDEGHLVPLLDTASSAREKTDLLPLLQSDAPAADAAGALPHAWVGDDAQRAAAHNPGGGAYGPAGELAAVYQCLLDGGKTGEGVSVLRESTVAEMTSRLRVGMKDHSFGQVVDWGLGFLINSARYGAAANPYGYGKHASDETFGHGGMQSSSGYADPKAGLAVAIIFNGLPGEPKHQKRVHEVNTALYEDLGLV